MGAKSYVLNLSENVRRSLEYKRRNGEWGGKAPLGYLNARDANNKSTLVPDPERAFLVRMLFEEYATGRLVDQRRPRAQGAEWGLTNKTRKGAPLSAGQIQHILQNPFYYGEMRMKGRLYPHIYEPLIRENCSTAARRCGSASHVGRPLRAIRRSLSCFGGSDQVRDARDVSSPCDLKKGKHVYLICRDPGDPPKSCSCPNGSARPGRGRLCARSRYLKSSLSALLGAHEGQPRSRRPVPLRRHRRSATRTGQVRRAAVHPPRPAARPEVLPGRVRQKGARTEGAADRDGLRIEQHQQGDEGFRATLETLISVASRAADIFARSKTEQKRQLIAFRVFEPAAERKKARVFIAFAVRPDGQ